MSLAEQLKAEGKVEGKAEGFTEGMMKGKIETANRLLAENVEIEFIARVTGLPLAKIKEIQANK